MQDFGTTRPRTAEVPRVETPADQPPQSRQFSSPAGPSTQKLRAAPTTVPVAPAVAAADKPAQPSTQPSLAAVPPPAPLPELDAVVADRASRDPKDVSAALDEQLLNYLRDKPVPSQASLAGLPMEDREIVSAVMDALVNFRLTIRSDPNAMFQSKVRPLAQLSDRLRLRSDLQIPVISLASKVWGFGGYDPLPAVISAQGNNERVIYYEVKDFSSRLLEGGMWETRLASQVSLIDDTGKTVWQLPRRRSTATCAATAAATSSSAQGPHPPMCRAAATASRSR